LNAVKASATLAQCAQLKQNADQFRDFGGVSVPIEEGVSMASDDAQPGAASVPSPETTAPAATPTEKHWYAEPVTAALVAGAVGLLGSAVNAFFSNRLEGQKQEGLMILEAIKTGDRQAAARNLLFLSQAALLKLSDAQKSALSSAAGDSTLPVLPRPGALGPENVEFTPSPALTSSREKLLADTLKSFAGYAREVGLPVTSEKIKILITAGRDASAGGEPGWLSRYNDATKRSPRPVTTLMTRALS
jgi:hypothetical protein